MAFENEGIPQFDKEELQEMILSGQRHLIDVRTLEEYEEGHIPGVPLKPLQEVEEWAGTLNPTEAYVFICRSGARSQKVSHILQELGFHDVANFYGGMLSWDGDLESGTKA